jgi:Mn-dependent DtxR family transcriptional regulator
VIGERPGVSVGEVAAAVEKLGVKKSVVYTTVNKLARDGVISKDGGSLTVASTGRP